MYLNYYKLKAKPFQISTDPRFLWLGETHKEALAVLRYGILDNKGFLLLTGEVGTGKTTLIHALMNALKEEVIIANVPDPGLEPMEFYGFIARAFQLHDAFKSKYEFLTLFSRFLHWAHDRKKKVLLVIDEAQRMSQELLEEIRLLSNIEKQYTKLINIFFVGQAEFNSIILEDRNRALRQRVTVNYNLGALNQKETAAYIAHRLKVAGTEAQIFKPGAIKEIHAFSKGYPRLINVICDRALLTGYTDDRSTISAKVIRECADDMHLCKHDSPKKGTSVGPQHIARSARQAEKTEKRPTKAWLYFLLSGLIVVWLGIAVYMFSPDTFVNLLPFPAGKKAPSVPASSDTSGTANKDKATPSGTKEDNRIQGNTGIQEKAAEVMASTPTPAEKYAIVFDKDVVLRVTFDSGNNLSKNGIETLDKLALVMRSDASLKATLKGYSKGYGSYPYNEKMAEFSANIAKGYLVGKGVSPERLKTESMLPEESDKAFLTTVGNEERQWVAVSLSNESDGSR